MAAQAIKSFHLDSHSNNTSSPDLALKALTVLCVTVFIARTRKMQNMSNKKGEELFKALIRKRTSGKGNVMESKPFYDSKKTSIYAPSQQNQDGKEMLKVLRKGTERLNMKESKYKSGTHSTMCFCSPTTHEGSFRCRLHRINAAKKSATEKNNLRLYSKRAHGIVEFKPQLSRFGRVASAEVGSGST
ncbi:hypothetical protein SESBI_29512 [Sesbania bispinosa]|nr:hypothetical protein SESBI_29512 [Sesbania bispinosa]